jgi:hypothetical protein
VKLGESRHLLAGDRVADENGLPQIERVENSGDVSDERVELTRWR